MDSLKPSSVKASPVVKSTSHAEAHRDTECFILKGPIQGLNDGEIVDYLIDRTICDLCFDFIKSSLHVRHFDAPMTRWQWHNCVKLTSYAVFQHYPSLEMLKRSAKMGCDMCMIIFDLSTVSQSEPMIEPLFCIINNTLRISMSAGSGGPIFTLAA